MAAYFQMGHDTENLVGEKDLDEFKGIILSPLNREPRELLRYIEEFKRKGEFNIVLDPQLYFPRSERGKLHEHSYFPSDLDTADISSPSWWEKITNSIYEFADKSRINGVASPVILPRVFKDDYFAICADVSQTLFDKLSGTGINALTTVMVELSQLADQEFVYRAASILSEADTTGYYIVLMNDIEPRREFSDSEALFGAMALIKELKSTGRQVIVSNSSSDMLLFKVAGADHCATGKFFNLRRFTKSRFEEPKGGGGQLPYWFEHSLLAFLREADVLRLINSGHPELVGVPASNNYWAGEIQKSWKEKPGKAWVALGWRQYLSWFGKTETALKGENSIKTLKAWLKSAEENWNMLEDDDILFEESRNNGSWLRPWRQALISFSKSL